MKKRKPVNLERLEAARGARGLSWNQLAKTAEVRPSTLSRLQSGRVKTVNPATLRGLADALWVPAAWLTGEQEGLAYAAEWDLTRAGQPSAEIIQWSRLMQRIENAVRRDLRQWYPEAEARQAYESWGRFVVGAFPELSSFLSWRTSCLVSPVGSFHLLLPSDDSVALNWLSELLEPWFAGRAYLNATTIGRVFAALCSSPERLWGDKGRDADGLRSLKEYAKACDQKVERATAKRLESELGSEPVEEGARRTIDVRTSPK